MKKNLKAENSSNDNYLTNGNMTLNIVFMFELPNDFDAKKILKEMLLNLDFVNR